MTEKRFVIFSNKEKFNEATNGVEYNDESIVFIKDTHEIWTHGTFFPSLEDYYSKEEVDDKFLHEVEVEVESKGIKFVDLGLPSGNLWASRTFPEDILRFCWGSTEIYGGTDSIASELFTWDGYKYGTENNLTKYNDEDGLTILQPNDDIITSHFGEQYHIPTKEDYEELFKNTTIMVHSYGSGSFEINYGDKINFDSGVYQIQLINKTDPSKYIYLPGQSECYHDGGMDRTFKIVLVTSQLYSKNKNEVYALTIDSDNGIIFDNHIPRYYGTTTLAVTKQPTTKIEEKYVEKGANGTITLIDDNHNEVATFSIDSANVSDYGSMDYGFGDWDLPEVIV